MTSAVEPPPRASAWARGRRDFRRWRRRRPFWGGLLLILSGLEMLYSSNLDLGGLRLHIGLEGFLSYLIPALMILSGALVWLHYRQRYFYSIIGTLTAIYSLIGLNLGGFFLGMLLGIVGGALAFAWTPVTPVEPRRPIDDDAEEWEEPAQRDDLGAGLAGAEDADDWRSDGSSGYGYPSAFPDSPTFPERQSSPDRLSFQDRLSGQSYAHGGPDLGRTVSAGHLPLRAEPGRAGSDEEEPPFRGGPFRGTHFRGGRVRGGSFPGPRPGLFVSLALPLLAAVATAVVVRAPEVALAEPCPPGSPAGSAGPAAPATGEAAPDPNPAADPSATPDPTASPSPEPDASPSATPTAGEPTTSPPPCTVTPTTTPPRRPEPPAKIIAVPPGQPIVSALPATLTADVLTLTGFAFDGVADLPTRNGTIRALQFSLDQAVNARFALAISGGGHTQIITADPLTIQGNVRFYTSRFSGELLGLRVEFRPDSPPQSVAPTMVFTDVSVDLVFISGDVLTGLPLGQSWPS